MVDREVRDRMLDAAEIVVVRQGIANLTLDAVAAEAGMSKGGLLHHFPNKDRLIEAMVTRAAENQRAYYLNACANAPEGRGRMARGVLANCLTDIESWTDQLRRSSAAVFAALAHKPALIEPMRGVYSELYRNLEEELPDGAGELVAAAADGLWLNWVLGLVPADQARMTRVRRVLETLLTSETAVIKATRKTTAKTAAKTAAKTRPKAVSSKSRDRARTSPTRASSSRTSSKGRQS